MRLKSTRYFLSMLTVICVFTACSKPVPPEKRNYVGEWRSKEMYLLILADGSVKYKRLKRGVSAEITGPIKEFQGDNFVVGIAFITTTFEVSKPPYQHNGVWYMVVDGVALRKINSPFICNDEAKIEPDDIARSIFLGQVYPSGNIYLRTFDETVKDPSFWPHRIKYHSLMSKHPIAAQFEEASFFEVMADRMERTSYGYRIFPKYIPYEEDMQVDVCNQITEINVDSLRKYLDSGDFFDSVFLHCEPNDGIAVYKGIPNNSFSYQVIAFRETFEIGKPKLLAGSIKRSLTAEEKRKVAQQKEAVKRLEDEAECTTVARFLDDARQYFAAKVKDSGLCIRISMYQTPGCAGHLARCYILDILRGNALLKKYEYVKYEGSI